MLTDKQIENMDNSRCSSFFNKQRDRFEVLDHNGTDPSDCPDDEAQMLWYDNQLEGFIAFNHFSNGDKVALLWDLSEEQHCLWINRKLGE
tara:strand:+ start:1372 stop:1641 length:270 start_codon:yes stop_codon:yes gene_type:complete